MTQNPVTIADAKIAPAHGNHDDVATPQPQPNQSAPASASSTNDITDYLRAQDSVFLDTARLTQFT